MGNVCRSPERSDLTGIQCRSAGTVHPVASGNLSGNEKAFDIALPPEVQIKTSVVVLGTECNLKHILFQIHALVHIEFDCRLVHLFQTPDRGFQKSIGSGQIIESLRVQCIKPECSVCGILSKIKEYPSPFGKLHIDQNIDYRASVLNLTYIERPLIALQEDLGEHLFRCIEILKEKLLFIFSL